MLPPLTSEHKSEQRSTKAIAVSEAWQARKKKVDSVATIFFKICAIISAILIVLIFIFVLTRGVRVFLPKNADGHLNLWSFLSGMRWRQDQGAYGLLFIIINTLISAAGASILAFPTAVLSALLIVRIAPKKLRMPLTTIVELLAAIPSVVYGVFASGRITQVVNGIANAFGFSTFGGNSLLAVCLLLAIMIYPTITSMAITAIQAVPGTLIQGSLALGASQTETNFKVVLTAAKSGIFAGLILGLGRAFGEATAVSMVAGNAFTGPTWNPFDITRTLTSTMLSGLKETTGLDYDVRFSVGIVLMIVILITNLAIHLLRKKIGGVTEQ